MSILTGQASAQSPSVAQVSSAVVLKVVAQRREPPVAIARVLQALHLAPHDDALARREREVAAGTVPLAEAALDALVDFVFDLRHALEVVHVRRGSLLRMTPGFSRPCGIDERLEALHDLVRVRPPLGLDERRHVAAGAVLGLQRAVVALHHQLDDIVHEPLVAVDFRRDRRNACVMTKWRLPSLAWPKMMRFVVAVPS